jgi:hypothetical protein
MTFGRKEFPQELKNRKKDERRAADNIPRNVKLESDHTVPSYLGGENTAENMEILTIPEHSLKHFFGTYFPELEQVPTSEYMGMRQIIMRMTDPDDFAKFLVMVAPLIPDLKERLRDQLPKVRKS